MLYREIIKKSNYIFFNVIKNSIENNKLAHAYLLSSTNNSLNNEAMFLIQSIISKDPFLSNDLMDPDKFVDLIKIDGSGSEIKKEEIINAISRLNESPLDSRGIKVLFINMIDNANKYSLNSLLKFLEEPTKDTFIIMTTNNESKLLDTIKSRSQIINIRPKNLSTKKEEFKDKGLSDNDSSFASQLFNDVSEFDVESWETIKKYIQNIETSLENAIQQPSTIFSEIGNLINKKNSETIIKIINIFVNDIWKNYEGIETCFQNKELLDKYFDRNFDYVEAIKISEQFNSKINFNVNIFLAKSDYLLKLEELYE